MPASRLISRRAARKAMSKSTMPVALLVAISANVTTADAQTYPDKPIRLLTAPAGGGIDFAARQVAQGIAGPLGQPVVIDNRVTILATEIASKAPPDGYSLLI